jgi:hypothetical protein
MTDPTTKQTISGAEGPPPSVPLAAPKPVAPPAAVPTPPTTDPAILGRALLDENGDAWPTRPAGLYGFGLRTREVLLVDPAVARALDAAREWRAISSDRSAEVWPPAFIAACRALATAVDALPDAGTDTPTPAGEASAQATGGNGGDTGADAEPAPAPVAHLSVADLADDCYERHTTTGVPAWAALAWLVDAAVRAPVGDRGEGLVGQVIAAGERIMGALDAERAPEPAGGPGWDRGTVWDGIEEIEQSHPVSARHLRALLADRDEAASDRVALERSLMRRRQQLREVHADADRLRDELAERTRERDYSDTALEAAARDMAQTITDRDRMERELAETVQANHRWAATHAELEDKLAEVRAELEYVRADREGLDLQRNRLLAERATARRDAAAGVLEWAAQMYGDPVGSLAAMAHLIRDGLREVPGSPEPAPAGGEETDHAAVS